MPEITGRLRTPRLPSAPASPAVGEMYYNTATNILYWWNGTSWVSASGGGGMNLDYLGDYNNATTYYDGDYVIGADGQTYVCVVDGTVGTPPVSWGALPGGGGAGIPTGAGIDWFTATPPTGFLIADGSAISRTTFSALFAVLGTLWGAGDGSTTFNLPDTRGRVIVGYAPGGNSEVASIAASDGTVAGSRRVRHAHTNGITATPSLNASHNITLPNHYHNVGDPGHSHTIYNNKWEGQGYDGINWPFNPGGNAGVHGAPFGTQSTAQATVGAGTGIWVADVQQYPVCGGGVTIGGSISVGGSIGVTGGTVDGPSFVVAAKAIKT
jgi:microcystin-dependent protein